jgi:hypothetical protein
LSGNLESEQRLGAPQDKVIGHIMEKLEHLVKDKLNTKYLGKTPTYMREICESLRSAERKIVIYCDYAPYCRFTDPSSYAVYRSILEEKARDPRISCQMLILGDAFRRINNRSEVLSDPQTCLDNFNKQTGKNLTDIDMMLEQLDREQTALLNRDFAVLCDRIEKIDYPMSVYAWIIDDRQAIFSIPNFSKNATEHGFLTSDPILIEALDALQARYRQRFGTDQP